MSRCSLLRALLVIHGLTGVFALASAAPPGIVVPAGRTLYRGFRMPDAPFDPAALLEKEHPFLAAGAARTQGTRGPVRAQARALLDDASTRPLADALGWHIHGLGAANSPWLSTTTELSVALHFAGLRDVRLGYVVRFRAPAGSIDGPAAFEGRLIQGMGQPFRTQEREVMVPGGIAPAEILDLTEYAFGPAGQARATRRWTRRTDGTVIAAKLKGKRLDIPVALR